MIRSVAAVLAGLGLVSILVDVLEFTLINAVTGGALTDIAGYLAVRNRPIMLGAQLGYTSIAAVLGGYLTARVAGTRGDAARWSGGPREDDGAGLGVHRW